MSDFYFVPAERLNLSDAAKRRIWRFEAALIGAGLWVFRLLPLRMGRWLAEKSFATLGGWNRRAQIVYENLCVAFPDASPAEMRRYVRGTFGHLGQAMAELAQLDKIWDAGCVGFELAPGAKQPSPDRPTVFVTAHVSAWEFTPLVARRFGFDIPIIYAPERNPYVDTRLNKMRRAYQSQLISSEGGLFSFMRALKRGQSVGMTVDTKLKGAPDLPFFGRDTPTNTGPASLAERFQIDLVPVLGERLSGGRYRVVIQPPIKPRNPEATQQERIYDMTRQINHVFEGWIRARPGEWLCLRRRWPQQTYQQLGIR